MISLSWSNFAKNRHKEGTGFAFSSLPAEGVVQLVKANWHKAVPGHGETDLSRKVVVPLDQPDFFRHTTVPLRDDMVLTARPVRRQAHEDLYVEVRCSDVRPNVAKFVKVVCYSAEALLENNGERSSDSDWEIVAILASDVDDEPMHPLTMARNFLEMPGGTKSVYTAEEFAKAIYYWANRVKVE